MPKPTISFAQFCADLVREPISSAWELVFKIVEGVPCLSISENELRMLCTGQPAEYVPRVYTSFTGVCGRRSEKTSTSIKFLIWKIVCGDWARPGRNLFVPLICQDVRIAHTLLRTAENFLMQHPALRAQIASVKAHEIRFKNGITLIVLPASKASARGLACPGCLIDEIAFVVIENADDFELVRMIKPSMIEFTNARRLLITSTPFLSRSGVLHDDFIHRAERPDTLVWQASTQIMTPRISPEELAKERERDPVSFAREYLAEFSTADLSAFLPAEDIHAATRMWNEFPPEAGKKYFAALDASALTERGDFFCFGIGTYYDAEGLTACVLRGWRKKSASMVLDEIAQLCSTYGVTEIQCDQYSFTFIGELMKLRGLKLEQLTFTQQSKMEIYFALKNLFASGRITIPSNEECGRELRALASERTSGGNYRIAAPRGFHDDFPSVLAILSARATRKPKKFFQPEVLTCRIGRTDFSPSNESGNLDDPFYDTGHDNWQKLN